MIKFLTRVLLISFIVIIISNIYVITYDNSLEKIITKKEIVFATRVSPSSYYKVKDKEIGFEYDLMKQFANHLDVKLKIIVIEDINKMITEINNEEIDIISSLKVNDVKKDSLVFNYPYNRVNQYLVYNSNVTAKVETIKEISNSTIEYIDEEGINNIFKNLRSTNPNLIWVSRKKTNTDELVELLNDDKVKYIVLNSIQFNIYKQFYSNLEKAINLSLNQPLAWAISPSSDSSLNTELTTFFERMIETNKLNFLLDKHFKKNQSFAFVGTRSFLKDIVAILPDYEQVFRRAGKNNNLDWRLLASIAYQESRWRKDAVSYTGVRGLMMLTQNTAKEVGIKNRQDPIESINGGAKYFRKLLNKLSDEIKTDEKIFYAMAAYNLGYGHVKDAMILAQDQNLNPYQWSQISPVLLQLSRSKYYKKTKYGYARGWEAVKYVKNIRHYYDILVFLDSQDREIKKEQRIKEDIPNTL
mgnify:CR=1 FL=1